MAVVCLCCLISAVVMLVTGNLGLFMLACVILFLALNAAETK
jgi:hypothetical protein